jgi:hypothetical protein
MRLMDDALLATYLENLDGRLARIEQILPTLATREDLLSFATKDDLLPFATKDDLLPFATKDDLLPFATKDDLLPLATKEEMRVAIDEAVAPLATREEVRSEGERSRRHMDVLIEGQRGDIQLLAEHLSAVMTRLTNR